MRDVLNESKPNIVLVHRDTLTLEAGRLRYRLSERMQMLELTDSKGIQEEALWLSKTVIVIRDTMNGQSNQCGTMRLFGTNYDLIVSEVSR